jgi:hypothetical protein
MNKLLLFMEKMKNKTGLNMEVYCTKLFITSAFRKYMKMSTYFY